MDDEILFFKNAIHPGYLLGMELKSRGITQKSFAAQIGMQQSHLSEIVKRKRSISMQIAEKIEQVLGIPAAHWVRLQAEYDYNKQLSAREDSVERDSELMLSEYDLIYDMRTIYNYVGIISKSASERLRFCKDSLHFASPSVQGQYVKGCFRKSEKTGLDTRMIATWTVLARYDVSLRPVPDGVFEREKMDELSKELSRVFHENRNTINRVERLLSAYGIRFGVVPKVKQASIDGYSFCSDDGVPSIVVTKRFDRIDNIAFAVLHEIGHLKLHSIDGQWKNVNLAGLDVDLITKEEREANEFAAKSLIPDELWMSAPQVFLNPHSIQREYSKWAKRCGLNKWIVLGRVSHETGMYMFKSDETRMIN